MADITPFPPDRTNQYLVKLAHIGLREGSLEEHNHKYAELIVVLSGRAVNVIDGEAQEVETGDIFVLLPGMVHEQHDMQGYRFAIFKFDYEAMLHEAGDLRTLPGFHLLFSMETSVETHPVLDPEIKQLVEGMTRALEAELSIAENSCESAARDLFMGLIALLCRHCRPSDPARHQHLPLAAETMSYLESHFAQPLSLDELAAKMGYSRRHFSRLFREAVGQSVFDYLSAIRLAKAQEMLERSDSLSLNDIAFRCGFYDASALCHAFRKHFGRSPRKLQKKD